MAELNKDDLISKEGLEVPLLLAGNFDKLAKSLLGVIENGKVLNKEFAGAKGVKELSKSTKKLSTNQTELEKVEKRLVVAQQKSNKEYVRKSAELKKVQSQTRKNIKQAEKLDSVYLEESRTLNKLRDRYKDLALSKGLNAKETKKLGAQVNKLDAKLKKVDSSVGQNQRNVGNYTKSIRSAAVGIAAWSVAVVGIVRSIGRAIQVTRDFEDANATLRGILNATRKETELLRGQQIELGKSTEFSATQVAKAQTELARLGVTQENIIDMTPGILSAATALGTDLASASELVAGQLNAFGLEAAESGRVADVLTKATQISALNFERLQTALGVVSPAAAAVGVSIEETTAVLGAAVDANIDASTAATGLRNIYIDLADKGITWEEAMTQINTSTNKLNTANELFGKRGAVVAQVIANSTDKIEKNTIALKDSAGTAESFAKKQLNTLSGSLKLLSSAWEGFILSIENGEGAMGGFIRGAVDGFTKLLSLFTSELPEAKNQLYSVNQEFNRQITILKQGNLSQGAKNKLIDEMNTKYKEYLPNLITEKDSLEELNIVQKKVNDNILNKILLQEQEADIAKFQKIRIQNTRNILKLELAIEDAKIRQRNANSPQMSQSIQAEIERNENMMALSKSLVENAEEELSQLASAYSKLSTELGINEEKTQRVVKANKDLKQSVEDIKELDIEKLESINPFETDFNADEFLKNTRDKLENDIDIRASLYQKDVDNFNNAEEEKRKLKEAAAFAAIDIGNSIFQAQANNINAELDLLRASTDAKLQNEQLTEEGRQLIQENAAKKERKLKQEQAKNERRQAVFGILANTALAIANILGQTGIFAPPFIAIAAATGLAQLLALPPIPQFWKGTESSPEGLAVVNEKGSELLEKNGKYSMVESKGSALTYLEQGTKVHTAKETQQLLAKGAVTSLSVSDRQPTNTLDSKMYNELRKMNKSLNSVKSYNSYLDGKLIGSNIRKRNATINKVKSMNRY